MNENQKAFLEELGALITKYKIDEVYVKYDDRSKASIAFSSNGERLHISGFMDNRFYGIGTECKDISIGGGNKDE